jgi:hypothetical protein
MAFSRIRDSRGLNIPEYQHSSFAENVRHETVIIPSTSQVAFGSYSIFDFKEKACLLNDIVLQFQVSNLNIITNTTNQNTLSPRFTPCWNWFTRIEIVQNNQIIDTIYPQSNFLLHQCFLSNEDRQLVNDGAGDYADFTKLFLKTNTSTQNETPFGSGTSNLGEYWYLPLWTYFQSSHIPMLYPKDDLQVRLYMDTIANCLYWDATNTNNTGKTPSANLTCNLLCNVTRLGQDVNLYRLQALNRSVEHYKFLELRYGTTTIQAGVTSFNYVLNAITGNCAFFFAVIRNGKSLNDATKAGDPNQYEPYSSFSILDSTSTNITGGQPVPMSLVQQYLSRKWTASSYYADIRNMFYDQQIWSTSYATGLAFNSSRNFQSTSYAIMYSFCDNPVEAANSGVSSGGFRFYGSEQLQIKFDTATTSALNVDIYAFVESCIETSPVYVKKLTL